MEGQSIAWLPGILIFVIGLAVGGALTYLFIPGRRRQQQLLAQIAELQEKHKHYREEVTDHFSRTADLVNAMTQSYKAVYQHLAQGAESLCGDEAVNPALQFAEPRLIGEQSTAEGPPPRPAPHPTHQPHPPQPKPEATEPPPEPPPHGYAPGIRDREEPAGKQATTRPGEPEPPKDYAPDA